MKTEQGRPVYGIRRPAADEILEGPCFARAKLPED